MPAKLSDFLSDTASTGAPLRVPSKGVKLPKSNYIGLALIPKNTLPDIGSATTYAPPGGTAAPVTSNNILAVLIALALNGQAWVFGNGVVNGKKGKAKEDAEKVIFGSRRKARPTGEIEEVYDFVFKYFYLNREFFNQLRLNYTEYDLYVFTDRSVETLRYDIVEPVFDAITDEVTGDNGAEIVGMFQLTIGSDGQVLPDFGSYEKGLAVSNFKYTFGVPVATGTGLSASLGGTVINKTAVGTGTITNAVLQTVTAGVVSYAVALANGAVLPAGITIDTNTGVVTLAAAIVAGSYDVRVAAENKTGVLGEYGFKLIAA